MAEMSDKKTTDANVSTAGANIFSEDSDTPELAEVRARAKELFKNGYNCAQSVIGVFAEKLGYDKNTILRLAQPFGGGMCRMREVCGTVSGMMMAVGLANGTSDGSKDSKDEVYKIGQKLASIFRDEHGSIICRELLGLVPLDASEKALAEGKSSSHNPDSPVSSERTADYYKKRPCVELCGDAAVIVQNWLDSLDRGTNNSVNKSCSTCTDNSSK